MSRPEPIESVILWDIDGTLLNSPDSRLDKHVLAVEVFLGHALPTQERIAGKTDRQLLCELLKANGTDVSSNALTEVLGILDSLSIKEISQSPVSTIPGAVSALAAADSAGWINGLLTGNTPARARAKLESASIWEAFDLNFGYFGDNAASRLDLVAEGISAIQSQGCFEVVLVGDTPLDIQSAKRHGLRVVAVATGLYSFPDLNDLDPDLLISDWESGCTSLVDFLNSAHN